MPSPATPDRRRLSLAWRLGALAVVALLLTAAVAAGRRPPATVADPVAQALAELREVPGVAHAGVRLTRPDDKPRYDALPPDGLDDDHDEARREPGAWLATVSVEPRSALTVSDTVEVAERVDAVMAGVAARVAAVDLAWEVWLHDDADLRATEVRLTGVDDVGEAVRGARALADRDGVRRVRVDRGRADVVVVRLARAPGLPSAAARHGLELASVVTVDGRGDVRVGSPQQALADPFVELAAAVELVPSVTRVALSDLGETSGAYLSVEVADDAATDRVDRWLRAPSRAPASGRTVSYELHAPGRTSTGYMGGVEPELPEPVPVEPSVPATPDDALPDDAIPDDARAGASAGPDAPSYADDPTAPACTGADLGVRIGGSDAALGSRFLQLVATNVSGRPCAVEGAPALGFRGRSGALLAGVTTPPRDDEVAATRRVVVPSGAEVRSTMRWGASSVGEHSDPATAVLVTPAPGAPVVELPVAGEAGITSYLDLLDGAVVDVQPWGIGAGG
ncbi:DUF4232 domain-containing protein [Cellulomonas sp. NS3]|uniref:DUF4232 domain-containing protein n=1 Tax=Cellulomonas sp. NS3 TaxID=2973977 RepID=UPI002163CCC0|nr:DUF4232 domain-containing protein [Cellulomonas sp. NS3]